MAKVALPRVGGAIEARKEAIARDLDAAQRLKVETEKAAADYEAALAAARGEGQKLAREARGRLDAEVEQRRARLDAELAAEMIKAEKRIKDMKDKALENVADIAASIGAQIVQQLAGARVSKAEVAKALPKAHS